MTGQAATSTQPDASAAPSDAGRSGGGNNDVQAGAASKMLDDTRSDRPSGSDSTRNSSTANSNSDTTVSNNDAAQESGEAASAGDDRIRRQVEEGMKSPDAKKLFRNSNMTPEMLAEFGSPELYFGPTERQEQAGQRSGKPEAVLPTSIFGDIADWAAGTFNKYIARPAENALDSMMDVFSTAGDWMFEGMNSGAQGQQRAPGAIADLNDVSRKEFRQGYRATMNNFAFDFAAPEGLKLPENATADGSVEIGGNRFDIFRSPDGSTFLKKDGKVIAQQKPDGSYDLSLKDDSRVAVRLEKDGDNYRLDHLERYKGDQLQQKYADGVYYNYNYDAQGNRTSVDAAADLQGPLTQEQLDQKLEAIRKELGPNGAAALRFNQNGERRRLLLQTHGDSTHSITDVNAHRARIFHNGQEYRLNEHDQLGVVSGDGSFKPFNASNPHADAQAERIRQLLRIAQLRAGGDGQTAVDGVKLETEPDGDAVITRVDPGTGETISRTELPADNKQPVRISNERTGETARLEGDKLSVNDDKGAQIFNFDPGTGFRASDLGINGDGLSDLKSGLRLDELGSLFDGEGGLISAGYAGEDWFFTDNSTSAAEHRENLEISRQTSTMVSNLGSLSISIARSGNPNAVGIARQVAAEALGIANGALSALGNDFLAQIPVYSSQSIAQTALQQALRGERTQTYAMRMGISDATRLSDFNRLATFSSTSLSPEEYVRHRVRAAA